MEYKPKQNQNIGSFYIFNNTHFRYIKKERHGSLKDESDLKKVLQIMGFETDDVPQSKTRNFCLQNLNLSDFNSALDAIANKQFSSSASLVMVFLSHGDERHIHMEDGRFCIEDIFKKFRGLNCPGLIGKPKIFIFQICRGSHTDHAVLVNADGHTVADTNLTELNPQTDINEDIVTTDGVAIQTIPAAADFLICNAAGEGFLCFRHIRDGSWFIQSLVNVLQEYYENKDNSDEQMDITNLLTLVSRQVAEKSTCYTALGEKYGPISAKQMPSFTSSLRGLFHLPRKDPVSGTHPDSDKEN